MATRSTITARTAPGVYKTIYCHFDGYPEGVGKTLKEHFTDQKKINNLMKLGALSQLQPSIECPPGHTFESPVKGYTIAYHRDRGEDLHVVTRSKKGTTLTEEDIRWWCLHDHGEEQYNYMWDGEKWYIGNLKIWRELHLESVEE